jgi:hypothetical protein
MLATRVLGRDESAPNVRVGKDLLSSQATARTRMEGLDSITAVVDEPRIT